MSKASLSTVGSCIIKKNKVRVFLFQRKEPEHTLNQIKAIPTSINTSVLDVWNSRMAFWSPKGSGLCIYTIDEVAESGTRTQVDPGSARNRLSQTERHMVCTPFTVTQCGTVRLARLWGEGMSSRAYHCSPFPELAVYGWWWFEGRFKKN